ncbi:MAG TPA: hypothetical protein VNQ73_23740 [Ilumatobacter sp.]|nr:hypothetical protein [Ilumatobacter sp.]
MAQAPDTVTEALALLRDEGYGIDYELIDGHLRADGCAACAVDDAVVERRYRFEGPSDPGDQMIVFGLRDPATGARGTLASAFGIHADPTLADHLVTLSQRAPS